MKEKSKIDAGEKAAASTSGYMQKCCSLGQAKERGRWRTVRHLGLMGQNRLMSHPAASKVCLKEKKISLRWGLPSLRGGAVLLGGTKKTVHGGLWGFCLLEPGILLSFKSSLISYYAVQPLPAPHHTQEWRETLSAFMFADGSLA